MAATVSEDVLELVIRELKLLAEQARESAGYNGARHDGGYSEVLSQIDWFRQGVQYARTGQLPARWVSTLERLNNIEVKRARG